MKLGVPVIYVGPEIVFRGLNGTLVQREDHATHRMQLHFQPESLAIRALPCQEEDVREVERTA